MMLTQHSLFLPTLLTSEEEGNPDSQVKGDPSPYLSSLLPTFISWSHQSSRVPKLLPELFSEPIRHLNCLVSVNSNVKIKLCLQIK
jgi:hypothetical protein